MLKKDNKTVQNKKQSGVIDKKNNIVQQDQDDFELKIQKVQKQVSSLNLDVKYLLEQRMLKQNVQKILLKERKNLQNCFLFKKAQKKIQANQMNQSSEKQGLIQEGNLINCLKDVNERILQQTAYLQTIKEREKNPSTYQKVQLDQRASQRLQCQTLHLKQIFKPQDSLNHALKVNKLRQKLQLLYDKVRLNLQEQQPYLHQKILQRIKRQAHKQSRQKLLIEIQILIKQNSRWMSQQTNRVSNQLQEKEIQAICVNNLGLMKKIMNKKVNNNDFIFENYSLIDKKYSIEGESAFPVNKVNQRYIELLKSLQQNRISQQLTMFTGKNQPKKQKSKNSLKQILQNPNFERLFVKHFANKNQFEDQEQDLLSRLNLVNKQIGPLVKN